MKRPVKRILTLVLGGTLVLVGIAGLFLPFLQGVIFLLAGLYVLSRESATAKAWLDRLKRRYPRLDRRLQEYSLRVRNFFRRRPDPPGPGQRRTS